MRHGESRIRFSFLAGLLSSFLGGGNLLGGLGRLLGDLLSGGSLLGGLLDSLLSGSGLLGDG